MNYDNYQKTIEEEFSMGKRNLDKELGPRDREAAIAQYQPKPIETPEKKKDYTSRYTAEDADKLSEGA